MSSTTAGVVDGHDAKENASAPDVEDIVRDQPLDKAVDHVEGQQLISDKDTRPLVSEEAAVQEVAPLKTAPVSAPKSNNDNKTKLNMTVEEETVDTSNNKILPIGGVDSRTEKVVDDSHETFLYDNGGSVGGIGKQESSLVPTSNGQGVATESNNQLSNGAGSTMSGNGAGSIIVPSPENTATSSAAQTTASTVPPLTPFMSGHVSTTSKNMKKPRFTHRAGSFHSVMGVVPPQDDAGSADLTLSNVIGGTSKYSDTEDFDDQDSSTFDSRSQFSSTTPRHSRRRVASMRQQQSTGNAGQNAKLKPYNTVPGNGAVPALRTITSKLFDSTGTLPRRYSGLPQDIDFDDFDDDLDDYGGGGVGEYSDLIGGSVNYGSTNDNYGAGNGAAARFSNADQKLKRIQKKNNKLFYSPHDFPNSRDLRWHQLTSFCYSFLFVVALLLLGFVSGFLLASTKDLQLLRITDATDILISDEELVFNLIVDAFNPGFMCIEVSDVDLEVFARSSHVHDGEDLSSWDTSDGGIFETVLLGSVAKLEIPLRFQGAFFSRQKNLAVTEIKIVNPCANDDEEEPETSSSSVATSTLTITTGITSTATPTTLVTVTSTIIKTVASEVSDFDHEANDRVLVKRKDSELPPTDAEKRWHNISQHPFELIIRGVFNYNLPILKEYKTVGVSKTVKVEPNNVFQVEENSDGSKNRV